MSVLGFTWTLGLFPVLAKHKLCFAFSSHLNNNQGKRGVPVVREESRRAHEGAHSEVLLSFKFHMKFFLRIADEDLKLLRTVQFLAKFDSNFSGLL